jgi:hypothetical protein
MNRYWKPSRITMKKLLSTLTAVALVCLPLAANAADSKETERLTNCGTVMEEVLNVPDNVPQNLLDRAECIIQGERVGRLDIPRTFQPDRHVDLWRVYITRWSAASHRAIQLASALPVLPVKVDSDKVARAHAVTPLIEAGKVFLPEMAPFG